MTVKIQFIKNITELTIPEIKLTRANNKTGTAIFRFKNPSLFKIKWENKFKINEMSIIDNQSILKTKYLYLYFVNGKPHTLDAIFIVKNDQEWNDLLKILKNFGNQNNLTFIKASQ